MKLLRKIAAVGLILVCCLCTAACRRDDMDNTAKNLKLDREQTVTIWYCDERYKGYLEYAAERFHQANKLVTIHPVLVSAEDYLTNIYDAGVRDDAGPDIFLMSADELERVYLMGLAAENNTYSKYYTADTYCDTAIRSATFYNKLYGYPLSFNVSYMVYNAKHVKAVSTFEELTEYNNSFEITDENQDIKEIVSWDVSDIFLNFGFSAGSIAIGGENGDNSSDIRIDEETLKNAMKEYSGLKDVYGIDSSTTTQSSCVESFTEGSLAYTILDMKSFQAVKDSDVQFEITKIPDYKEGMKLQSLADTSIAVVSQYADNLEVAKAVAHAFSYDYADSMVGKMGMLSARNIAYEGDKAQQYKTLYDIYQNAVPKAKFIGSSTIYTRYEIMISQIWNGGDIDAVVGEFVKELTVQNQPLS